MEHHHSTNDSTFALKMEEDVPEKSDMQKVWKCRKHAGPLKPFHLAGIKERCDYCGYYAYGLYESDTNEPAILSGVVHG